jgi:hypothetical protein
LSPTTTIPNKFFFTCIHGFGLFCTCMYVCMYVPWKSLVWISETSCLFYDPQKVALFKLGSVLLSANHFVSLKNRVTYVLVWLNLRNLSCLFCDDTELKYYHVEIVLGHS